MVHVVAYLTATPGRRQDILDILMPLVPSIQEEPGCVEYTVTTDAEVVGPKHPQTKFGPDTYIVVERWATLADLERHSKLPVVDEFFGKIEGFMADRVVHFLSPYEG
jgi:quinol monooxygenase YgiN